MTDNDARPDTGQGPAHDARLGRIRFRAWRRGFREADMVLGPFCDAEAPSMNDAELDELERLLDAEDQYLYAWIIGREPTPPEYDGAMMTRIRAYMHAYVAAAVAEGAG